MPIQTQITNFFVFYAFDAYVSRWHVGSTGFRERTVKLGRRHMQWVIFVSSFKAGVAHLMGMLDHSSLRPFAIERPKYFGNVNF